MYSLLSVADGTSIVRRYRKSSTPGEGRFGFPTNCQLVRREVRGGDIAGKGEILGEPEKGACIVTSRPTPVDPPELYRSPAFAQGMIAPPGATLYVGGQNGQDASGQLLKGGGGAG